MASSQRATDLDAELRQRDARVAALERVAREADAAARGLRQAVTQQGEELEALRGQQQVRMDNWDCRMQDKHLPMPDDGGTRVEVV